MNEPRPTIISTRPCDTRSRVANSWKTRTGSAALSTVTALVRRMRFVRAAADPVRVFQEFATLDLVAQGRAEMIVGRGSFIEAFPLFGLALDDYDELFTEKLGLLLQLRASTKVQWSGAHRPPLTGQGVYPRPLQNPLPV